MKTTKREPGLLDIVGEMLMLVQETEEYHPANSDLTAVLQEARRMLRSVHRRLKMSAHRYVVGVVGLTNVGKSTLLNALLAGEIAPHRNGPCTAAPIEFEYGENIVVTAYPKQGFQRRTWACNAPDDVHRRLAQMADSGGASIGGIDRVVVTLPDPLLANGLVVSDTPGFGAAQLDAAEGTHEESLKAYLRQAVSQVFWVVLADQGVGSREKRFHDDFFSDVCDDLIVTGCEDWDDDDRKRFRKRFEELGSRLLRFHFVSGKEGLEARRADDMAGLEKSGVNSLAKRIRELADPIGRETVIRSALEQLADDIAWWLGQYRDTKGLPIRTWWRPDSWARFCTLAREDGLAVGLQEKLEQTQ